MGKSYKQNDRHSTKSGRNFNKPRKAGKQVPDKKWKQSGDKLFQELKEDFN